MYGRSARFYDAIYSSKDYAGEAAQVDRTIQSRNPGARTLLDVACGTGAHLAHLAGRYAAEGVDISEEQLAIARERLPGVPLQVADMVELDLGRRFDAVTCLFSAIGYVRTVDRLNRAVAAMARHLEPGGVLIVEPWLRPEVWQDGHLSSLFVDEDDIKIARLAIARTEDGVSVMDMEHLVATHEDGVQHFVEHHELGLFTVDQHLDAFRAAGLAVEHDPEGLTGRGLYIGVRTSRRCPV
jgi:SAM-dependent methyltransferase